MFRLVAIAAVAISLTVSSKTASAQDLSVDRFETTYEVQVLMVWWQSLEPHWVTEMSFDNREDAETVVALYELALEEGELHDILDLPFGYLVSDVRLNVVTTELYPLNGDLILSADKMTLKQKLTSSTTKTTTKQLSR